MSPTIKNGDVESNGNIEKEEIAAQLGKAQETIKEQITQQKEIMDAQTELLKSNLELEKSKKALITEQIGSPTSTNEATSVAIAADKTPFFAELLAHQVLLKSAQRIGEELKKYFNILSQSEEGKTRKIMLIDSPDLAVEDVGRIQIKNQLEEYLKTLSSQAKACEEIIAQKRELVINDLLKGSRIDDLVIKTITAPSGSKSRIGYGSPRGDRINTLSTVGSTISTLFPPINAGIEGISALITGVSNIMGFFQDEHTLTPTKTESDLSAFQAAVVDQIKDDACLMINRLHRITASILLETLQKCLVLRATVDDFRQKMGTEAVKEPDPEAEVAEKPKRELMISACATMIKDFDDFFARITAILEGGKYSPLMIAVMREQFDIQKVTHYLFLKIVTMGGDVITSKSIWPWISSRVVVMAGSVCSAVLVDESGNIVYSKTIASPLEKTRIKLGRIQMEKNQ